MLIGSPYNLQWGSNIIAKVIATNLYGNSVVSKPGGGAIILTSPDPPINLAEDTTQRSKTTLGIKWD